MAEEEQQQDFSKLSLEDRCHHKNWKARTSAYDELAKLFVRIDDDKEFSKYGGWVRKFPTDSNAAAQEKALEVALLYLEYAPVTQAGRIVPELMSGVVTKCITASKAKSKELAMNIALMCVEVEKFEGVQEELMKGMEQKNPKVVAGCINIMTEILKSFGHKVINLKLILKKIPILIEDRDKTVREETKKLMVELYRWLGPAFKPQLSAVKPLVVQEVEAEVEKCTEKPHQSRYLRSQQAKEDRPKEEEEEAGDDQDAVEEEANAGIDPYDLLDPVDILSKLPKDFYEKCESKKWQERKEAMEALETLVANPKLEVGDYADLVRMLKKIISKDSNVMVVALAGKCLAGLANGLKKKFSPYASSCVSSVLEKFKEKKPNVVTAMRDAIDAAFASTSLEAIQEDTIAALQNKNPAVKLETNSFLARAFAKTSYKTMSDKKLMKPYFTAILANLNESDASVREAAAEALGVAMKHLGEKTLSPLTADLEPIKLSKVKEFCEKAVITAPKEKGVKPVAKVGPIKSAPAAGGKKPVVKKAPPPSSSSHSSSEALDKAAAPSKPASAAGAKKPVNSATGVRGTAATKAASKKPALKVAEETLKTKDPQASVGPTLPTNRLKSQRISDEMKLRTLKWNFTTPRVEFVDLLKELMSAAGFKESLIKNMFDLDFKMHIAAIDTLQGEFNLNPDSTVCNSDLILKWATLRFFDTNPSVLIRILDYLSNVFSVIGTKDELNFGLADIEANSFVPYLVIKLGDSKETIRSRAHNILRLIAKVYSPSKLFLLILEGVTSKNAKQRADSLEELGFMISTYGMDVLAGNAQSCLKEIAKHISDRDQGVRNGSLNAIIQAYHLVGEKIYKMIGNLAAKDLSLLEERIKRVGKPRPPQTQTSSTSKPPSKPNTQIPTSSSGGGANSNNYYQHQEPSSPPPINNAPQSPETAGILQPHNMNATVTMAPDEYSSPPNRYAHLQQQARDREIPSRSQVLPEKYRIDFDAIDRKFDLGLTITPLELLDTNVDQFLQGEVTLPKRRTVAGKPKAGGNTLCVSNQGNQSIDRCVMKLKDADLWQSMEACIQLEKMIDDEDTVGIMGSRVETMLLLLSEQFEWIQPTLVAENQVDLDQLNKFFRSSVSLLSVLFKNESLPKSAKREGLEKIIYQLLVLIIDENLSRVDEAPTIIRLVNIMIVRIIENSDPNAISCALIRLLKKAVTLSANVKSARLLELVMKCQWKLLKQHNVWIEDHLYEWDVKEILSAYGDFVKEHPFSSFNNKDGTPLKTLKTIIHALVVRAGPDRVGQEMNGMLDLKNSEGGIYIQKIIIREKSK